MPQPELKGKVSLDGSKAEQTLNRLASHGKKFAADFKAQLAGVFTVAAVQQVGKAVVNHITRIKDLSEQYQVTKREVQELDFALSQTGLTFEDFGPALIKFAELRKKAGQGEPGAQDFFTRFKIWNSEIQDPMKRNIDLAIKFVGALKGLSPTAQQSALSEAFGTRSGSKFLEAMRKFEEIRGTDDTWIVGDKDIDNVDQMAKKFDVLVLKAKALAGQKLSEFFDDPAIVLRNAVKWSIGLPGTLLTKIWGKKGQQQAPGTNSTLFGDMDAEMAKGRLYEDEEGKKILKEQQELLEKIDKLQRSILGKVEHRKKLEAEIAKHLRNAEIMRDADDTEGKRLMLEEQEKAVALAGELVGMNMAPKAYHVNELQRIGGYVANAPGAGTQRTVSDILKEVKKIVRQTQPKLGREPFSSR